MTRYKLQQVDGVECSVLWVEKNMSIPLNPDNTDYQEYLKWLDGYELQGMQWVKTSEGNEPLPADN